MFNQTVVASNQNLTPNTTALYLFEGNATDRSNNGYTISKVGSPTFVLTPTPVPQGTIWFQPSDNNYYSGNATLMSAMAGANYYSLECNLNMLGFTQVNNLPFSTSNPGNSLVSNFEIDQPGTISFNQSGPGNLTSAAVLSANTNYHVAWSFDGTTRKIYVNGKVVASVGSGQAFASNLNRFFIGGYFGGGGTADMLGTMKNVRICLYPSANQVPTIFPTGY